MSFSVNDYIISLSSYDTASQQVITLVAMHEKEFGHEYYTEEIRNKAVALYTCHVLKILEDGSGGNNLGSAGTIKSQKEGDLAVTKGFHNNNIDFNDNFLGLTNYGIMLMSLNKASFFKPMTKANEWLPSIIP